jgi:hypothetical protein
MAPLCGMAEQAAKNFSFGIPNGVSGERNLLFPCHLAKSRSLAVLEMTNNYLFRKL